MTYKEICLARTERILSYTIDTNQTFIILKMLHVLRAEKLDILNLSPAFYGSILNNFTHYLMVEISKMFDCNDRNKKGTESTYFLVKSMKNNLCQLDDISLSVNQFSHISYEGVYYKDFKSTQEMLDYYLDAIEKEQDKISSIRNRRNKYYAHWDRSSIKNIDKLFADNFVSMNDVENLLVLNSNICVSLYHYFRNNSVFSPIPDNCRDFNKTLCYIEEYKKIVEQSE